MASKDHSLYQKDKHDSALNDSTGVYRNFNLNKSRKCTPAFDHKSSTNLEIGHQRNQNYEKTAAFQKVSGVTERTTSQNDKTSMKKSLKNFSKDYFKSSFYDDKKESENLSSSNNSSSTLSLHIAAYENFVESQVSDYFVGKDIRKKGTSITTSKKFEQSSAGLSYEDQLEFPRQQNNDPSTPQVQQFSASQKLFTPIQAMSMRKQTVTKPGLTFKEQADKWIRSKWGRRFRLGLLGGTFIAYPIYHLIAHGPLLNFTFSKKHNVDYSIPPHLQLLVENELNKFREQEGRSSKDSKATFCIQKDLKSFDTVADGSLGVRFGAHIGLPLYTLFTSEEQALNYFKENWDKMKIFGQKFPVSWDSPAGRDFISTFVLSPEALKFLIMRDLYANDGYNAYANRAIAWSTFTAFTNIFTYWLHQKTQICNGTARSFAIVYSLFLILAIYGHNEWYLLYRFMAETHGDSVAARYSYDHSKGGKEYYWKMLKRNRILRDLMPNGKDYITAVGDIRGITTKLVVRYDLLKDVGTEDDEIKIAEQGDV